MLMNNIKNNNIYEFGLSSREPFLVLVLDYKISHITQSNPKNLMEHFGNGT